MAQVLQHSAGAGPDAELGSSSLQRFGLFAAGPVHRILVRRLAEPWLVTQRRSQASPPEFAGMERNSCTFYLTHLPE